MKKKELIIYIGTFVGIFILGVVWSILVSNNMFDKMDQAVLNSIVSWRGEKGGFVYWVVRIVTEGAYLYFLIPFILIIMLLCRFDLKSMTLGVGAIGQYVLNSIVKSIVQRPRPDIAFRWMTETSSSYPSGHSCSVTFTYGFLIYLIWNTRLNKNVKIVLTILSGLMIPIIMFTRLVLGVHYLSDVLGGLIVGSGCVLVAVFIHRWFYLKGYNGFKRMIDRKIGNMEQ